MGGKIPATLRHQLPTEIHEPGSTAVCSFCSQDFSSTCDSSTIIMQTPNFGLALEEQQDAQELNSDLACLKEEVFR